MRPKRAAWASGAAGAGADPPVPATAHSLIAYGPQALQPEGFRRVASSRKTPKQIALGQAVRAIRTRQGMTQEQVANAIGMHTTYVSDIERGSRNPSWIAVTRLAAGLRVPVADIAAEYDRRSNSR
jgi:DNA-binding XRE family transcriptional regulator